MLRTLLAKDLLRIRRNPLYVIIMIAMPFVITALIGLAFGGFASSGDGGGGFGRIKVAIVDEDDSILTRFLRNAATNDQFAEHIEARFIARDAALELVTAGEISAIVVIPDGFTRGYLSGESDLALQLIKNPAQGMYPALIEEGLRTFVTGLNGIARVLGEDLREWSALIDQPDEIDFDLQAIGTQLTETGQRLDAAREVLYPPLITYSKSQHESAETGGGSSPNLVMPYILVGMSTMFLLYLADHGMRDLYRELRFRTLERYRTANEDLLVFIVGKILVALVITGLGAGVLLGGGTLFFDITWPRPLPLLALTIGFCLSGAGVMGLLAALAGSERRADVFNNIVIITMAMLGGSMFPLDGMPAFFHRIAAVFPTHWFNSTARAMLWSPPDHAWITATAKLVVTGLVCALLASVIFRRRLDRGVRA